MSALKRGENLITADVNALPAEASVEKAHLQAQGIRSLLNVPINTQNGILLGFIGFDDTEQCRTWSDEDLRMLRIVSEMLST
jgi:GAF domain-containing protein